MSTQTIHVVTFEPLSRDGGVGGFQWFPEKNDAEAYYNRERTDTESRYQRWTLHLPAELSAEEITDWIDDEFISDTTDYLPDADSAVESHTPQVTLTGPTADDVATLVKDRLTDTETYPVVRVTTRSGGRFEGLLVDSDEASINVDGHVIAHADVASIAA